jgi:hypothetical protein
MGVGTDTCLASPFVVSPMKQITHYIINILTVLFTKQLNKQQSPFGTGWEPGETGSVLIYINNNANYSLYYRISPGSRPFPNSDYI